MRVGFAGHDSVKVTRDRADVLGDRPFVVVEHNDEPLRLADVVERLVADPVGKRRVSGDDDDVFIAAFEIAPDRHAERGGKGRAGVARAVAIVLALRAQEKTVEPAKLAHRGKAVEPAGEYFVDVTLVTHVHDKPVARRVEDAMERDR